MSEVRVVETVLPLVPRHVSCDAIKHLCEVGHMTRGSMWFTYEGRHYTVQRVREDGSYWFDGCAAPTPEGAVAYGKTLWELSK